MSLEVRIRRASETASSYLCEIEWDEIPDLIPTIEAWTVEGETPSMGGQFVLSGPHKPSYFEVVIHEE